MNSYGKNTTAGAFPLDKRISQLSWVFLNALSDNIPSFDSLTIKKRVQTLSLEPDCQELWVLEVCEL